MIHTDNRIAQLEEENRLLKAKLVRAERKNEILMGKNDSTFRAMFNHSADGMMLIDSKGIIREWNSGFERIMGLDKETVVNNISLWELLEMIFPFDRQTIEDLEQMKSQLKEFVADMRERALVRHMKHCKTGENRILEVIYFPVAMPGETMLGGIGRDVTKEIKYRERQDILIKVLQIMQSADSLPQAINEMLSEIGKFAGVSRVYVFEKNDDETAVNCTFEWCNSGISSIKSHYQNTPVEVVKPWLDVFDDDRIVNTSDVNTIHHKIVENHHRFGAKSFLDFPLTANGEHYGFVGFDECAGDRAWDENEVELLKSLSQIISVTHQRYLVEQELDMEHERLQAIGDHFPNGSLFRFEVNPQDWGMKFTYLSATWEEVMGISIEETMADASAMFGAFLPEYIEPQKEEIKRCALSLQYFLSEYERRCKNDEIKWLAVSSYPRKISEDKVVFDGFVLDITARKKAQIELAKHRDQLEFLVKERTEELEEASKELLSTNEELQSTNEELQSTNEELYKYQTLLEEIVTEKTGEVIARREDLEKLSRRQAILIKVLHTVQLAKNLPEAMSESLAEIGNYTGVSRVYVFEKNSEGNAISCIYDWSATGVTHIIDDFQNTPIEVFQPWFEIFSSGNIINASDINKSDPQIANILKRYDVKSFLDLPLTAKGVHYGFVGFDECSINREWDKNEVELLQEISQILSTTRRRFRAEQDLINERDRIKTIGDNFPDGSLYRYEINPHSMEMCFSYVSATWENVMGFTIEETKTDISIAFASILPEFVEPIVSEILRCTSSLDHFLIEYQKWHKGTEKRWILASATPKKVSEERIVFDGFVLDITDRKNAEIELEKYREHLEFLVKERTEEIEVATEELQSANEELLTTNEELNRYQTQLEELVLDKTVEVIARQEDLEKLSRRQAILIKVLQIVQSSDDLNQAINESLAEIGRYAGVSRVHVFEKTPDETMINNTFGWCNEGVKKVIDDLQNIPVEKAKSFFDMFDAGIYTCASNDRIISPDLYEMLFQFDVRSIVVFPLSSGGTDYGFVVFDECVSDRVWDENEVELLKSLSQILTSVKSRLQAESALHQSHQTMRTVLDNLPTNVFVTDIDTMEILFANKTIKEMAGMEDLEGKKCWKTFRIGQKGVCGGCPHKLLLNSNREPTGVFHWEYFNELFQRHFSLNGVAIEWIDGRLAQMEVALDITDRKLAEIELIHAKERAEESDMLKSAFLANMSHEIRTPLNAIVGFLNIITSEDMPREREQELFKIINNSAGQLTKLIDDIVDVAKIEAKQLNILPVATNINQMMNELLSFFETYLQTQNKSSVMLLLDDSGHYDNCNIMVDPVRLRQVLNNLIGNAIKFTEKGYVRFGYRQTAPDKLEFMVEDTGIGMALDKYEIVFERFRKIGNHFYGGIGLGLNIAYNIVQMMGGDIWLETAEGEGTTFYFDISLQPVNL